MRGISFVEQNELCWFEHIYYVISYDGNHITSISLALNYNLNILNMNILNIIQFFYNIIHIEIIKTLTFSVLKLSFTDPTLKAPIAPYKNIPHSQWPLNNTLSLKLNIPSIFRKTRGSTENKWPRRERKTFEKCKKTLILKEATWN